MSTYPLFCLALQQLSELVSINLSHNKIRDIVDLTEIPSRNVLTMDFSYNQIDYIPPEISKFYFQLTRLYLNDNQLSYIPTDIFKLIYLTQANCDRLSIMHPEDLIIFFYVLSNKRKYLYLRLYDKKTSLFDKTNTKSTNCCSKSLFIS